MMLTMYGQSLLTEDDAKTVEEAQLILEAGHELLEGKYLAHNVFPLSRPWEP